MLMKTKVILSSIGLIAVAATLSSYITQTNQALATEANTTFEVNVKDSLTVSVTTPSNWATGDVDTFLRNKISVNVSSNASNGFTASMTTKTTDTSLTHTANKGTIPTLSSSSVKSAFPANYWGYSLDDTDAGSDSSTYNALVGAGSSPIILISNAQSSTISSRDIYFGAKANASKASGTYMGTVVISVVTGAIEENSSDPNYNPTTPENPATPGANEETPYYNSNTGGTANGSTTYTYSRTSGSGSSATTTTTTQVSDGDNRNSYVGYTAPQGVTNRQTTTESISEGSSLATGLAVTSAVAATAGTIFFILAKRKKDDDEEEEEEEL